MHILFLIEGRGVGGNETLLTSLFQKLKGEGSKIVLACPPGKARSLLSPHVSVALSPAKTIQGWERLLKKEEVHLTVLVHGDIVQLAWASRKRNIPSVWMYGHPYWLSGWEREEVKILGTLITHSCAQSRYLANQLMDLCGEISILPNGVDQKSFYPLSDEERKKARKALGFKDNEIVLGYPARGTEYKRHRALLSSFNELRKRQKNLRLFFLGANSKEFTGAGVLSRNFAPDEMRAALGACDLTVFPAEEEGYGCAVAESLALGVPALMNAKGGHAEFQGLGRDFFYKKGLTSALEKFISSEKRGLQKKAIKFSQSLSRDVNLDRYSHLFTKLAKG